MELGRPFDMRVVDDGDAFAPGAAGGGAHGGAQAGATDTLAGLGGYDEGVGALGAGRPELHGDGGGRDRPARSFQGEFTGDALLRLVAHPHGDGARPGVAEWPHHLPGSDGYGDGGHDQERVGELALGGIHAVVARLVLHGEGHPHG